MEEGLTNETIDNPCDLQELESKRQLQILEEQWNSTKGIISMSKACKSYEILNSIY